MITATHLDPTRPPGVLDPATQPVLDSVATWALGVSASVLIVTLFAVAARWSIVGVKRFARSRRHARRRERWRIAGRSRATVAWVVGIATGIGATVSAWMGAGTAGAVSDAGSERVEPSSPDAVPVLDLLGATPPTPTSTTTPTTTAAPSATPTTSATVPPTTPVPTVPPTTSVASPARSAADPAQADPERGGPLPERPGSRPNTMGSDPTDAPERGAPQRTGEAGPSIHTVRPGEHFWKIASDRLGAELERPPSDREVVGYWLELIEANRDRLVDPDDPDLIHPGLELVMPVPEVPGLTSR